MEEKHTKVGYSKITENVYVGTNLCCLVKSHVQILLDLDIHAEIDLEIERQDPVPEVSIYMWLPVKDHFAPSEEQFDAGVALIEEIVEKRRRVYIHCRNGHGRSPTLLAAYFIKQGISVEEAIQKVKSKRDEIHIEEVQVKALEKYKSKRLPV